MPNNSTFIIRLSNDANQPGINPPITIACGGVNTNDNIRLTTLADVVVDNWGRTDGVNFTPNNQTGYDYRRNTNAVVPNPGWDPADWTITDWTNTVLPDYGDLGTYTPEIVSTYQYNIDGGPWQADTLFTGIAVGIHTINVRNILTGCTSSAQIEILPAFTNTPVTTIGYTTPVCINDTTNPSPDTTAAGFVSGGKYTADSPLLSINLNTGVIDLATSAAGSYIVTYTVDPDLGNCIAGGSSTAPIVITPVITPNFPVIPSFCSGTVAPLLGTTSPNGIQGTWLPAVIDNLNDGTYVFTPLSGQCAGMQTLNVDITAPNIMPDFAAINPFCAGTAAPLLGTTSPNGISGTWLPAVIDNLNDGTYVFTPDAGQCALQQPLTVVITPPTITPVFAIVNLFCAGDQAPILPTTSQNNISGTWQPAIIDNMQSGNYVFTPSGGQCALPLTLIVTVTPTVTPDFAPISSICDGGVVPTLGTTSPNGVTGTWQPAVISPTQSGIYTFTPDLGQCANNQVLEVTISTNPVFTVDGGCVNGSYILTVLSSSDFSSATFIWRDEQGNIVGGNESTLTVTQTGTYSLEINNLGCSATQPRPVVNISCTIQKGISPKGTGAGDGKNDFFDLTGQNVSKLQIFNRYGTIAYSKSNYTNQWYGQSDNGGELPDGTYFYVIDYKGQESKTGWIYINHEQ